MRVAPILLLILSAACEDRTAAPPEPPLLKPAEMRSGPAVPVTLPTGFTIYPGARITGNTVVQRGDARRVLVEFQTRDPVAKVMQFHRAQAQAAGVSLTLDLDGTEAASIGGRTAAGGDFALTARRAGLVTRVEMAFGSPR